MSRYPVGRRRVTAPERAICVGETSRWNPGFVVRRSRTGAVCSIVGFTIENDGAGCDGRALRTSERVELVEVGPAYVDPEAGVGGGGIFATYCPQHAP